MSSEPSTALDRSPRLLAQVSPADAPTREAVAPIIRELVGACRTAPSAPNADPLATRPRPPSRPPPGACHRAVARRAAEIRIARLTLMVAAESIAGLLDGPVAERTAAGDFEAWQRRLRAAVTATVRHDALSTSCDRRRRSQATSITLIDAISLHI